MREEGKVTLEILPLGAMSRTSRAHVSTIALPGRKVDLLAHDLHPVPEGRAEGGTAFLAVGEHLLRRDLVLAAIHNAKLEAGEFLKEMRRKKKKRAGEKRDLGEFLLDGAELGGELGLRDLVADGTLTYNERLLEEGNELRSLLNLHAQSEDLAAAGRGLEGAILVLVDGLGEDGDDGVLLALGIEHGEVDVSWEEMIRTRNGKRECVRLVMYWFW